MRPEPDHRKNKVKLKCLSQFKQWNFSIFTQRQFFVFFSFLSADIKMIWLDNLQCHDFSNKLKHLKLFFFPEMINTPRCFLVRVLKLRHDDVLIPLMQLSYSPSAFISTLPHLKHKASGNLHMYWCSLTLVYKVIHNTKKKNNKRLHTSPSRLLCPWRNFFLSFERFQSQESQRTMTRSISVFQPC